MSYAFAGGPKRETGSALRCDDWIVVARIEFPGSIRTLTVAAIPLASKQNYYTMFWSSGLAVVRAILASAVGMLEQIGLRLMRYRRTL